MESNSKRPVMQAYVPLHKRNDPSEEKEKSKSLPTPSPKVEVKRKGRGQFRAPSSDSNSYHTDSLRSGSFTATKTADSADKDQPVLELIEEMKKLSTNSSKEDDNWKATNSTSTRNKSTPPVSEDIDSSTTLECYDLTDSIDTQQIYNLFKGYATLRGGFKIKRLDSARALIIFEDSFIARRAYTDNRNNTTIKVRHYKDQVESKYAPRNSGPRRPTTTNLVANRLIHGALGIKNVRTPEQRELDKQLMEKAKEGRETQRLEMQNRQKETSKAFDE